ncbi:catabolite control protein A, partial [Klebsiella oxytoca]
MGTVTIKDIARIAGVSCATVSRVLNGSPTVAPELRDKILDLCRQYGYRRNLLARG